MCRFLLIALALKLQNMVGKTSEEYRKTAFISVIIKPIAAIFTFLKTFFILHCCSGEYRFC